MHNLRRLLGQLCGVRLKHQDRMGAGRLDKGPCRSQGEGVVAQPRAEVEEVAGRRWIQICFGDSLADGWVGRGGAWDGKEKEAGRVTLSFQPE